MHLKRHSRVLPLGGDEPIWKILRNGEFCAGVLLRIQFDDVVAVDQARVAFNNDDQQSLVIETEPGAPVGKRVCMHRARGIEGLPHPAPNVTVPSLRVEDIGRLTGDIPKPKLGGVCATSVASRHEGRLCGCNCFEGRDGVAAATNTSRVSGWADDDEIIPCYLASRRTMALVHELPL